MAKECTSKRGARQGTLSALPCPLRGRIHGEWDISALTPRWFPQHTSQRHGVKHRPRQVAQLGHELHIDGLPVAASRHSHGTPACPDQEHHRALPHGTSAVVACHKAHSVPCPQRRAHWQQRDKIHVRAGFWLSFRSEPSVLGSVHIMIRTLKKHTLVLSGNSLRPF